MRELRDSFVRAALPLLLCAGGLCGGIASAQDHSRAELRGELERMDGVVRTCAAKPEACTPDAAPEDEMVAAEGGQPKFAVRWDWLRQALEAGKSAQPKDRQAAMERSAARLQELAEQAAGDGKTLAREAKFGITRKKADEVLRRPEFQAAGPPSLWDRIMARVWGAIYRLFSGFGKLGAMAPWLGSVLEWVFFLSAAVAMLLFLRRNFQRQRLQASLRGSQGLQAAWDREATDWAALAERSAAGGDWRDAVHCLYWASIVRLESRRAWRHNPTRTPREYVRLLKPGSVQRESLGGLTGLLERVWYGLRPAAEEDYRRARRWFDRLSEVGLPGAMGTPVDGERT